MIRVSKITARIQTLCRKRDQESIQGQLLRPDAVGEPLLESRRTASTEQKSKEVNDDKQSITPKSMCSKDCT